MSNKKFRNCLISLFVIVWSCAFHYESVRHFYLNPLFEKTLPKVKFLFPPAGWIMFFQVNPQFGFFEVYGKKGKTNHLIDPHDIFRTRTIMFDNIHRGILGSVDNNRWAAQSFCRFLHYRFPFFDDFIITSWYYPDVTKEYFERYQQIQYQCRGL